MIWTQEGSFASPTMQQYLIAILQPAILQRGLEILRLSQQSAHPQQHKMQAKQSSCLQPSRSSLQHIVCSVRSFRPVCPSNAAAQRTQSVQPGMVVRVAQDTSMRVADQFDQQPQPSTSGSNPQQQHHSQPQQLQGKVARFAAQKHACKPVQEQQRELAAYMALPASQYSVLDARKIERLDDTTFKCYVGRLAFFGFSVEPVITVSVVVEERGCTIKLLSAQLQGSDAVQDINSKFTAQMTNVVRWQETAAPDTKEISSDTSIEVVVQVPGWFGFVPVSSIEAAGSKVMSTTVNLMVPRFLEQLQKDYQQWAAGDESRKPVGEL